MKKEEKINFKIDNNILKNYVKAINSIKAPMNQIKEQLNQISKQVQEIEKTLEPIKIMSEQLKMQTIKFPNEQYKIYTDAIKQIMDANKGMLSTRMIEPLDISRQYLSIMENKNYIEKIARGIYISPSAFEDSYFAFQQKYKKVIFSHMNALYFHGMTEEFPYNYTVTVPNSYHVDTANGNKVRAYDKERCICDIIKSKGRMDSERVKKTIRKYIQRRDKEIAK